MSVPLYLVTAMPRLILMFRNQVRGEHALDRPVIHIGRALENDIVLANQSVSRKHAQIVQNGDHHFIKDLNSTSGLLVNGEPVKQRLLQDGDLILIGKHTLLFQRDEGPAEAIVGPRKAMAKPGAFTVMANTIERRPTSYLIANEDQEDQKQYRLDKIITTLGAARDQDVPLKGFGMPDQVAEIHFSENRYFLIPFYDDLEINDRTLIGPTPLKNGDMLRIQTNLFRFLVG